MAHRNRDYAEDVTISIDEMVVVENTPSQDIFGGAASDEELLQDKDLTQAVYDFIYGDEYDSGDDDIAAGADEKNVEVMRGRGDSASTQALAIVSSDPAVVDLSEGVEEAREQGGGMLGDTEVEDHNCMIQRHHEELMRSGEVSWYTAEYGTSFEERVRLGEIIPLGDFLPLQIPALPEEGGGSEVPMTMSATNAGYACGGDDIPIEARLRYALLADQKQRLKRLRVALQLRTEKLMEKTAWEEQARMECFFQMQLLMELGSATYRSAAFRQQLIVAENAHIAMVEAELGRHGEWLLQQQLKWNVEEQELALLLLKNQLKDVAV